MLPIAGPLLFLGLGELVAYATGQRRLADDRVYQQQREMELCRSEPSLLSRCRVAPAEPGQTVIYTLGGSSVRGHPIGIANFSLVLDEILRSRFGDRFLVRNHGAACRDSIYVRNCAAKLRPAGNAVLLVYAGHNDMANFVVPQPALRYWSEEYPALLAARRWLARTRFYSLLVERSGRWPESPKPAWGRMPSPDYEEARSFAIERYAKNLRRMIEQAGEQGVPVIWSTLVSNLYEFPIQRDKWRLFLLSEQEPSAELRAWHAAYVAGIQAFEEARYESALAAFKEARDQRMAGRAPAMLNQRIRELAAEYPHVTLLDMERRLDELGAREGIGCNFFGEDDWCDQFHPNTRLHRLMAEAFAETVEKLPPRGQGAGSPERADAWRPAR